MSDFVVAIDGPAGSGKSSVSRQVARELNFGYLDTGAAYRALAWAVLETELFRLENLHIALEDVPSFERVFGYQISTDPQNYFVRVGEVDVTERIRSSEVSEAVSAVARIPAVREFMKTLTRTIAHDCKQSGIVIEGRDITTVVAPDAQVKILLTADETVRLKRRSIELGEKSFAAVVRQVSERDASDAKVVDFMTPAIGVTLVDSTNLDFRQTVSAVCALIEQQRSKGI
jgi:cytidylate kinase